jgi:hypothetical protein
VVLGADFHHPGHVVQDGIAACDHRQSVPYDGVALAHG